MKIKLKGSKQEVNVMFVQIDGKILLTTNSGKVIGIISGEAYELEGHSTETPKYSNHDYFVNFTVNCNEDGIEVVGSAYATASVNAKYND